MASLTVGHVSQAELEVACGALLSVDNGVRRHAENSIKARDGTRGRSAPARLRRRKTLYPSHPGVVWKRPLNRFIPPLLPPSPWGSQAWVKKPSVAPLLLAIAIGTAAAPVRQVSDCLGPSFLDRLL